MMGCSGVLDRPVAFDLRARAPHCLLLLAALVSACGAVRPASEHRRLATASAGAGMPADTRAPAPSPAAVRCTPTEHVDLRYSNYCLGLSLHRGLLPQGPVANAVLSPLGLQGDLSLSYLGASGETRRQIGDMFAFAGPAEQLAAAFEKQLDALAVYRARDVTPGGFTRHNVLFADDDLELKEAFVQDARKAFRAVVKKVDFANPAEATAAINEFSAQVTNSEIARALPEGLPPETRLVQLGSLYFHKRWTSPFQPAAPGSFTLADGTRVEVPVMRLRADLRHDRRRGCDVVELRYQTPDYSFFVLVPREQSLPEFERDLTPEMLLELTSFLQPRPMELGMPRFQLLPTGAVALRRVLEAAGMTVPFDPDLADFSPSTSEQHALHDIYQSVMLRVDEHGTTAAAVTASVRIQTSGREPEKVEVDRPFLFLLRENNSGLLLLLGRVGDPRVSG
jgi:serpin B